MEPYVIRTEGGPHPGQRLIDGSEDWMTWPPPDILDDDGGHYEKVSQSGLPPMDPQTDRVIRGAMYEWVPDPEVGHELLARELVKGRAMPKRNLRLVDASINRQRDMADIDDEIVFCRARGFAGGHDWPNLRPGKRLPKNFRPVLQRDGTVMVTETCNACGKVRWYETGVGGAFDLGAKKHYKDPRNWKVMPRDLGYSSRDFDAEAWRRRQEDILAIARANAVPEEDIEIS